MQIVVEINSDEQHLIETSDHLERRIQTCEIEYRFDVFLFRMLLIMIGKHKDTKTQSTLGTKLLVEKLAYCG